MRISAYLSFFIYILAAGQSEIMFRILMNESKRKDQTRGSEYSTKLFNTDIYL